MDRLRVERHWYIIYVSVGLLIITCFFLIWRFNQDIIIRILTNDTLFWNDVAVLIGSTVVLFLMFGGMAWIILSDAYINFTSEGIHRPGLRNAYIRWNDIKRIDNLTYQLVFTSVSNVSIRVNLLMIKDLKFFLHEINQRLPQHLQN